MISSVVWDGVVVLAGEGDMAVVPGKDPGTLVEAAGGGDSVPDKDEIDTVGPSASVSTGQALTLKLWMVASKVLSCKTHSGGKLPSDAEAAA